MTKTVKRFDWFIGALAGSERVILEGFFVNGYMEGPVRGLDEKGNVVFIGAFEEGIPKGPCWLSKEGQGWIHGIVDKQGKFSGPKYFFLWIFCPTNFIINPNFVKVRNPSYKKIIFGTAHLPE